MRTIALLFAIIIALVFTGCRNCSGPEDFPVECPWDAGQAEVFETGCECPERNECEEFLYIFCQRDGAGAYDCEFEHRESGDIHNVGGVDFLELTDIHYGCCATVGGEGLYFD